MDITNEVLSVAKQYLQKVKRSGNENIMAICPFHRKADGSEEKNPSFSMSLTKGVYFCHQCHAKGTLRKFFKEFGLDNTAINLHYSLLLDEVSRHLPGAPNPIQPKTIFGMPPMEDSVLGLFDYDVRTLMPQFSEDTLRYFEVGWDGWWKRITFPIRDIKGDLVGISGRAVHEGQTPRYKVYENEYTTWHMPERKGWNKRAVLWNMHNVLPEFLLAGDPLTSYVLVVEGFRAAMWAWQCGYKNVVALLGSHLSWEQEWMLNALGCKVLLFLDNDSAGRRGTADAASRLMKAGPNPVYIVEYPERIEELSEAQPDDLTQEEIVVQVNSAKLYTVWKYCL